jgi:hypothetical protein
LTAVLARSKELVWVSYIDKVMPQPRTFFRGGFGGAQVHAAINGHRIATDNLAAEALAQR